MHDCPQCGQACYCSGDMEDHDTGEEFAGICSCCCENDEDDEPLDCDGRDDHIHLELPSGGVARVSPDASPKLLKALDNLCRLAVKQEMGNMRIVVDCVVMREPGEDRPIKIRVENSRAFSGDILYFGGTLPLGPAQLVIRSGTEMRNPCPACCGSGTVGVMGLQHKGSECTECHGSGEIEQPNPEPQLTADRPAGRSSAGGDC